MRSKPLSLRIPETLEHIALMRAKEEHLDKATVVRQWIHQEAERYVLGLARDGKLTIARAAEILDISVHEIQDLARRYQVELGPTDDQLQQSKETVAHLISTAKR
ncbi:MAG: hypothetical protein WD645_01895 [Dehalococcoidia bacterium]